MSKLSKNLQKNEELILEGVVHWGCLIMPIIYVLVSAYVTSIPSSDMSKIGMYLLIASVIRFAYAMLAFVTTQFSLSTKRLVGKYGFINTKQMDSPLNKINSVSVANGLLGKIFGFGDIVVATSATTYKFKNISKANKILQVILAEIEKYEEARIKEQAQAIAGALKS